MGVFHFCISSEQRHQQICISDYLFKDTCIIKSLRRQRQCLPYSRGKMYLLSRIVMIMFLCKAGLVAAPLSKIGLTKVWVPHCMFRYHLALSVSLCRNWGLGNQYKGILLCLLLLLFFALCLYQKVQLLHMHRTYWLVPEDFIQLLPTFISPPLVPQQVG